jgi:UDP-N-acetylglucosamine 2-epimerase
MKLTIIAGARPNFIKIAPLIHAIEAWNNQNQDKLCCSTIFFLK